MKMWLCIAALAVVGSVGPRGPQARAQSAEMPPKADAPGAEATAWGGYAPASPWKAYRPESSWRGYAPRSGWKVAPTLGPLARREGGVGRDLVTVERPPLAGR